MTPIAVICGGFFAGFAAGALAGADLSASAAGLAANRARLRAAFGLVRRMTLFGGCLLVSLLIGPAAWAGAAAGYLAGFALFIRRAVRA